MKLKDLTEGMHVVVDKQKVGTVRFIGVTKFASGEFVGIELDRQIGDHSGAVEGLQYFVCRPNCGIFARPSNVELSDPRGSANAHLVRMKAAVKIQALFRGQRERSSLQILEEESSDLRKFLAKQSQRRASVIYAKQLAEKDGLIPIAAAGSQSSSAFSSSSSHARDSLNAGENVASRSNSPGPRTTGRDASRSPSRSRTTPIPKPVVNSRATTPSRATRELPQPDDALVAWVKRNEEGTIRETNSTVEVKAAVRVASKLETNSVSAQRSPLDSSDAEDTSDFPYTEAAQTPVLKGRRPVGRVWVWGENTHGELSIKSSTLLRVPTRMRELDETVATMCSGNAHSVALTTDGRVHTCGSWLSNLLGHPGRTKDLHHFKELDIERATNIGSSSPDAGAFASTRSRTSSSPARPKGPTRMSSFTFSPSALNSSSAASANSAFDIGGTASSSRALGSIPPSAAPGVYTTGSMRAHWAAKGIAPAGVPTGEDDQEAPPLSLSSSASSILFPSNAAAASGSVLPATNARKRDLEQRVLAIACGDAHSIAQLTGGKIVTWGGSLHGKLGRGGDAATPNEYLVVTALEGKRVVSVACGNCHTVVCTDEGHVWTFGGGGKHNNYGQLGQADGEDTAVPRLVTALSSVKVRIVEVVCGGYHSLAISSERHVYSWGRGDFGQLGHDSQTHVSEPVLIKALKDIGRAKEVAAGSMHSLALMQSGAVYSCGFGQYGQLGHGSAANERLPRQISYFENNGISVAQIAAGQWHSICLTVKQTLFTWGHGERGQLGHGSLQSASVPQIVESLTGANVQQVTAGGHHSSAYSVAFKSIREMQAVYEEVDALEERESLLPATSNLSASKQSGGDSYDGKTQEESNAASESGPSSAAERDSETAPIELLGEVATLPEDPSEAEASRMINSLGVSLRTCRSASVHMVHRFITFQTFVDPAIVSKWARSFVSSSCKKDKGFVLDTVTIISGSIPSDHLYSESRNVSTLSSLEDAAVEQKKSISEEAKQADAIAVWAPDSSVGADGLSRITLLVILKTNSMDGGLSMWGYRAIRQIVMKARSSNADVRGGITPLRWDSKVAQWQRVALRELRPVS